MDIVVFLKMVPDVVEELVIGEDGKSLDTQWLRMKLNDPDEHALEEAVILKEKYGGTVTVVAMEAPEVEEVLFTALAKGADRAVKLPGDWTGMQAPAIAKLFTSYFSSANLQIAPSASGGSGLGSETLILIGSQAIDDLEGEVAPYLAEILGAPYVGVVTGIRLEEEKKKAIVMKEFAGGLRGEFELPLPAVLGIQAAEKPPRYVLVAKVRSIMKSARIETVEVSPPEIVTGLFVERMFVPEAAGKAEMIEGPPEKVSARIIEILVECGIIRR
ncbi:MAG: electron transfer flavoprotein subunit beta/FixA family protein [Bacteroidetes bacterium]|nr:electron transfer flavoprotein subunit beta/FixA family protein [Bacteroidota bacterium]